AQGSILCAGGKCPTSDGRAVITTRACPWKNCNAGVPPAVTVPQARDGSLPHGSAHPNFSTSCTGTCRRLHVPRAGRACPERREGMPSRRRAGRPRNVTPRGALIDCSVSARSNPISEHPRGQSDPFGWHKPLFLKWLCLCFHWPWFLVIVCSE